MRKQKSEAKVIARSRKNEAYKLDINFKLLSILTAIIVILWSATVFADGHTLEPAPGSDTVLRIASPFSAKKTLERVETVIAKKGLKVFDRVDHAAAAKAYETEMPPTWVFIFGNPKVGTPLMMKNPASAIDFPLKGVVYEDKDGKVWLGYNSPTHMKAVFERHGLSGEMGWYEKLINALTKDALKQ